MSALNQQTRKWLHAAAGAFLAFAVTTDLYAKPGNAGGAENGGGAAKVSVIVTYAGRSDHSDENATATTASVNGWADQQ